MLKRTALFEEHQKLGGRLIDFGGWELPVQYSSVMEEHLGCRNQAGLFDVSHMGEVHVEGADAEKFLNFLVTNDVSKISVGQAQYTVMCHASGGIVDDLVIYKRGPEKFLVVVNASNTEKDFQHFLKVKEKFSGQNLTVTNESARYTQIALQGPKAADILSRITDVPLKSIKTYWFSEGTLLNRLPGLIARTGYTGEDGFELYVAWEKGPELWRSLMEVGADFGLKSCGLAARDTLRLEMKYPLYGNELSDETHPLEAGLGWVVKLGKEDFMGKSSLLNFKQQGLKRQLVGLKLLGKGIIRHGYALFSADGKSRIGEVTSGTQSPCLKQSVGIGYVELNHAPVGTQITVEIRGAQVPAEVISTPFYQRPY